MDRDGGIAGGNYTLRLAKAFLVPFGDAITLADIVEADYSGYSPLVAIPWTDAFADANNIAVRTSPIVTFSHNGGPTGNNVLAWYVTHDIPGPSQLIGVELFSNARGMFFVPNQITLQVSLGARQGV